MTQRTILEYAYKAAYEQLRKMIIEEQADLAAEHRPGGRVAYQLAAARADLEEIKRLLREEEEKAQQ